jgi:exopolyphosphatase / guanosine-5'-triphosphate,3'-diphosphate pyrophosphatase
MTAEVLSRMPAVRVGIVDVGSNTVRLLVAARSGSRLVSVRERRSFLGLGEEVESYGWISDLKLRETGGVVRAQVTEARELGVHHVEVVVTAPGRQAANSAELVDALTGASRAPVRVLAADEEGRLAFQGVLTGLNALPESIAVCDLGGGSTELVVGTPGGPVWERSLDLGCVRLTHRLELPDPPGSDALPEARAQVRDALDGLTPPLPKAAFVTGGTARALRRLAGRKLGQKQLRRAEAILSTRPASEIADAYELDLSRAKTLLAGSLILAEIQERIAAPLVVARTGLREGMAIEVMAELAAA